MVCHGRYIVDRPFQTIENHCKHRDISESKPMMLFKNDPFIDENLDIKVVNNELHLGYLATNQRLHPFSYAEVS